MTQNSVSFSYQWKSRRCCINFPLESSSLARLLILTLCLSLLSLSRRSSLTSKQFEFSPLLFVAITIFWKQFTRNWALRSQNPYAMKELQANSWAGCYGYHDDKSVDSCCLTHFNACTKYDKGIPSPSAGISSSTATPIVCVSSPSCTTVEEATSCSFESRIFKEKKTTHLVV